MQNTLESNLRSEFHLHFIEMYIVYANEFLDMMFYESPLERFIEYLRPLKQNLQVAG